MDDRQSIVEFLEWWAGDQQHIANTTLDRDRVVEFAIRAQALRDAARDIADRGDERHKRAAA